MGNIIFRPIVKDVYRCGMAGNKLSILGYFFEDVESFSLSAREMLFDPINEGFSGNMFHLDKEGDKIIINHQFIEDFPALIMPTAHLIELINQWIEIIKTAPDEIVLTERNDGTFYLRAGSYLDIEEISGEEQQSPNEYLCSNEYPCQAIFSSNRAKILKHYLKEYPHQLDQNILSLLIKFTASFTSSDTECAVNEAIKLAKEQKSKNLEFAHLIEGLLHAIEKNERLSKTKVKDRALRKELMKFYAAKEEQSTEEFAQNFFARLTFNFSKNDVECMVSYASALAKSEGTSINVSHLIRGFLHALQLNSRLGTIYSTQAAAVTIGSLVAAYLAYKGVILTPTVIKNIMDKLGKIKPTQGTQGASAITSTTSATSATGSKPASTAKK